MKRNFLRIACLSLGLTSLNAQNAFFEPTDYVGALSKDETKDWTKTGWTNFDPKNAVYPDVNETSTLAGGNGVKEITTAVILDATKTYLLSGVVAIKDGGSLTIPAGTVIRGASELDASTSKTNYAMIVVEPGGKIFVNGTADKPVVMTSLNPVGQRARGDWAGLVLFGKAQTNVCYYIDATKNVPFQYMEGFNKVTVYNNGSGGAFGGYDPNNNTDNSGVLKYLRVEFAGLALDVNKEVNGITFGGIGSGTTVDYVQVSYSNDDSFEWFGGSVNCKHLIAYISTDDDFDTDNGYSGNVQFGIALKHPSYFDATYNASSGPSTSEGFESDNDATGTNAAPRTSAIFSNMTMVGPISLDSTYATTLSSTTKNAFRRGARLRRNSRLSILKTVFIGYRNFLMIDGSASMANYGVTKDPQVFRADSAMFQNNFIVNTSAAQAYSATSRAYNGLVEVANSVLSGTSTTDTATNRINMNKLDAWTRNAANMNTVNAVAFGAGTLLIDPQNFTNPNFRPVAESPLGVNEVTYDLNLGAYPNPVAQNATLYIAELEENYSLVNTQGVLVKAGVATKVNMTGVDKGLYILKVGKKTTKIVVE